MTINNKPAFIATPKSWFCATTGAGTSPDGSTTTNMVKLVDADANQPQRIERVVSTHAPAASTTDHTAGIVRYYVKKAATTFYLLKELVVADTTRSATVIGTQVEWSRTDGQAVAVLNATDELWVGVEKAEPFHHHALGGPF